MKLRERSFSDDDARTQEAGRLSGFARASRVDAIGRLEIDREISSSSELYRFFAEIRAAEERDASLRARDFEPAVDRVAASDRQVGRSRDYDETDHTSEPQALRALTC